MDAAQPASANELALRDLNVAAERIWLDSVAACPGLSIEVRPELGSTNTELMARGRQGDANPILLAAVHQTAGRGRQGRSWLAEPGCSLTFSLGLPLRLDEVPGGGSALSLAVGLAIAEALDQGLQTVPELAPRAAPIGLKWPNDLLMAGRKLGGILIEATAAPGLAEGQRWVVIGAGINVRGPMPEGATALMAAAMGQTTNSGGAGWQALNPGMVWAWIAPRLIQAVRAFEHSGFAPLQFAYSQRDVLAGQRIGLWPLPGQGPADGHQPEEIGMAQGVSPTGALLVHTGKGSQSWTTGEVSVRLQAP